MDATYIRAALHDFITRHVMRDANYTIEPDEDMFKNGLFDSFALAEVGVFIEETFGVYIPDPELTVANMSTLDKMTARVLRDVQ